MDKEEEEQKIKILPTNLAQEKQLISTFPGMIIR